MCSEYAVYIEAVVCSNSYCSSYFHRGRKVRQKIQSILIKASAGLRTENSL